MLQQESCHEGPNMHTQVIVMSLQEQRDFAELQLNCKVNDVDLSYARQYGVPAAVAHSMSEDEKSQIEHEYFLKMHSRVMLMSE